MKFQPEVKHVSQKMLLKCLLFTKSLKSQRRGCKRGRKSEGEEEMMKVDEIVAGVKEETVDLISKMPKIERICHRTKELRHKGS